ncbi:MAG TPA: DoxX family protein [Allosphingosinicella sp.]|jgi:putative oxidoreductase
MNQNQLSDHAALLLRLSMGTLFLAHGLILKVLTFTPAGTAAYFASIGYPPVLGYVVIAAEIAGALALIAGVQVRLVSLLFVPLMIGAALQHLGNGWTFSNAGGGWEFPVFWTVLLFVQALLGAGSFSLARLAGIERKSTGTPALA